MTEAGDGVGEFGLDSRVQLGLGEREGLERVDRRLDLPSEVLEDQVLILHLGDETSGLEDSLAVPAGCTSSQLPLLQRGDATG